MPLVVLAALVAAPVATSAPAVPTTPCWKTLLNDWFDGRIDGTYPARCYREAIKRLPDDVDTYSSAREDLQRALFAALRATGGPKGPNAPLKPPPHPASKPGTTKSSSGTTGTETEVIVAPGPTPAAASGNDDEGVFGTALGAITPGNADSVPLPLIVLAALAMLLLAAAGAGLVTRRLQARKEPVSSPPTGESPPAA